jgi:hypothetical protein
LRAVVRVGWVLSGVATLLAVFFAIVGYIDARQEPVGTTSLNLAADHGLGWAGVFLYGLVPALVLIWTGVALAVVLIAIGRRLTP